MSPAIAKRIYYGAGTASLSLSLLLAASTSFPAPQPVFWLIALNWVAFITCSLALTRLPGGKTVGLASWRNRDFNFWRIVILSFSAAGFFAIFQGVPLT